MTVDKGNSLKPVTQNKHGRKNFPETNRANSCPVQAIGGFFGEVIYAYIERWRLRSKVLTRAACLLIQKPRRRHEEILFRKITHHLDPEIRKILIRACFGTRIRHSILVHNLLATEIRILFLKLTMMRLESGIFDSYAKPRLMPFRPLFPCVL